MHGSDEANYYFVKLWLFSYRSVNDDYFLTDTFNHLSFCDSSYEYPKHVLVEKWENNFLILYKDFPTFQKLGQGPV